VGEFAYVRINERRNLLRHGCVAIEITVGRSIYIATSELYDTSDAPPGTPEIRFVIDGVATVVFFEWILVFRVCYRETTTVPNCARNAFGLARGGTRK